MHRNAKFIIFTGYPIIYFTLFYYAYSSLVYTLLTPETPEDPLDMDSSESEYGLLANMIIIPIFIILYSK